MIKLVCFFPLHNLTGCQLNTHTLNSRLLLQFRIVRAQHALFEVRLFVPYSSVHILPTTL
jgi:hypothetical protein